MKAGKMTSVENGPERDVELRVTAEEIYSELAELPGVIPSGDISSYELCEKLIEGVPHIHLSIKTSEGKIIPFYMGTQFDLMLLLDELDAVLGERPRVLKEGEQQASFSAPVKKIDKDEMLRDQVTSKIHWGVREEEVKQWLEEEKGIMGKEADQLLKTAWKERRKAIRAHAFMTLILSILGLILCAVSFAVVMAGRWVWAGYGVSITFGLALFSVFWFFKSLYYLLVAKTTGPVE